VPTSILKENIVYVLNLAQDKTNMVKVDYMIIIG